MSYKSHSNDLITSTNWINLNGTSVSSQTSKLNSGVMAGETTRGFHGRKRAGMLLPHTSYSHWESKGEILSSTYSGIRVSDNKAFSATGLFTPQQTGVWMLDVGALMTLAQTYSCDGSLQDAAARIYTRGHDTLTFLAELRKTVKLVRGARENLRRFLETARRKRVKDLSEFWLEYRYGWRILYYDIVSIVEALETLDDKSTRFSERAGTSNSWTEQNTSYGSWSDGDTTTSVSVLYNLSRRGSITADITPPKFRGNLVLTAWELTRFSFVIDWFLDVGRALEALSFVTTVDDYSASHGWLFTVEKKWNYQDVHKNRYTGGMYVKCSHKVDIKIRKPATVKLRPQVDVNLDIAKGLDIASLVREFLNPKHGWSRLRV